jgi:hypothetical protein
LSQFVEGLDLSSWLVYIVERLLIDGREPKHFLTTIRFLARPLPRMKKSAKNKEALNNSNEFQSVIRLNK